MPNRYQRQVIKDAIDNAEKLTDFEYDLIMQWAEYPDDRELSEKQNKIINEISQKLFD